MHITSRRRDTTLGIGRMKHWKWREIKQPSLVRSGSFFLCDIKQRPIVCRKSECRVDDEEEEKV